MQQPQTHKALFVAHKQRSAQLPSGAQGPGRVSVRLHNYAASALHMRQLKSKSIGRLATIRGTVVRMSHIRPLIMEMGFSCAKCYAAQDAAFPDGRFAPPTRCVGAFWVVVARVCGFASAVPCE